jgi:hypothetical protein
MGRLRTCVVSYSDQENIRHSGEVTAETLYEAAVLGLKPLKRPGEVTEHRSNLLEKNATLINDAAGHPN